jgi:hypothetical protein
LVLEFRWLGTAANGTIKGLHGLSLSDWGLFLDNRAGRLEQSRKETALLLLLKVELGLFGFRLFDSLIEPINRELVVDRRRQPAIALDLLF